jgi:hypothetical protein
MKVKPKEVLLNLPIYLLFNSAEEIPQFAANVNAILAGKKRLKYEEMGTHDGQFIGLFYLDRHDEYFELREFVQCYMADGDESRSLRELKEEREQENADYEAALKQQEEIEKELMAQLCPNGHRLDEYYGDCEFDCIHRGE